MPNILTRILLFLSSYAPLFVIFGIRSFFSQHWEWGGTFIALAVLAIVILLVYLQKAQTLNPQPVITERVSTRSGETMSYIVSYLLPFLGVDFSKLNDAISMVILFLVIGIIYVNSNLIYINPVLNSFGFNLFEIETDNGKVCSLISKRTYLKKGTQLSVVNLGNYVLMEKI